MTTARRFQSIPPAVRLSDRVAQALTGEIRSGRLVAGDKLPTEPKLAEQFSVSRTVIREAVSRMKSVGLVDSRQGSGVYVCEATIPPLSFDASYAVSKEAVVQMVELRRGLETEVAGLAAERRSKPDVRRLRQACKELDGVVKAGGHGVEEDAAFHRAIGEAARNPFLLSTLQYLNHFLMGATRVIRVDATRRVAFSREVQHEHDAIVDAIEAQDVDAARAAAFEHMNNSIRRMEQIDPAFWQQEGGVLARLLMSGFARQFPEHSSPSKG